MDIEYLKMITEDQKVSVLYKHAEAYMINLIEHGSKDEIAFLYESYQDSFNDYVNFLQTQPRYQDALEQTESPEAFIDGLHKAGYATDPAYAEKIKKIMNSSTVAQFSQQLNHS